MVGELGFDTGPFVNAAAFCDAVLEEKDNVMSLIRIVDSLDIRADGPEAPDELPPGIIQSNLVVLLRAGQARGGQTVQIVLESPDGSRREGPEVSIQFPGGPESGARLVMPMKIETQMQGLYWADVLVNKRLMTRVPLEVSYGFKREPKP